MQTFAAEICRYPPQKEPEQIGAGLEFPADSAASGDVQTRIRELIKLAKEQGYLTFDDLNEALPSELTDADELDTILTRLRRMEIDIIEASEVDRYKDGKKENDEEEEEKPELCRYRASAVAPGPSA